MLIVEGPDGSGKTTLVKHLSEALAWPVAERVVDKNTNEMVDLVQWVNDNLNAGFQRMIFDRHRLISDPIYRFILPHKQMDPRFYSLANLTSWYQQLDRIHPLVVYCLPPLSVVLQNLLNDPDNIVVHRQAERIYYAYLVQATRHAAVAPDWVWIYDYTENAEEDLLTYLQEVIDYRTSEGQR